MSKIADKTSDNVKKLEHICLETKVKAIVIGNKDYKEKDMLVTLFTLEEGIITVTFKGVKNTNAKLKAAKEIFSFGDFIYVKGKTNVVVSADIIDSFYDITKNLSNFYSACNILKIIRTVLPEGETSPSLFVDTLKALNVLSENKIDSIYVLNKFLIRVFEGFGYKFNLNKCSTCGCDFLSHRFMNLRYGDITCFNCRVGEVEEISPSTYQALRILSQTDYSNLQTLKLSTNILKDAFTILHKNYIFRFNQKLDV